MKHVTILLIVIGSFSLSSCLSEYRAQRKAEAFAVWEQRCKDYGHKIGTEAMAKCKGDEYRAYRQRINQN
ncbi:hypothetical protein OAU49_02805 [Alphaproteobacteria bacterium]|nr:hypothetical protein [Alphaproteobacteria bacterium]